MARESMKRVGIKNSVGVSAGHKPSFNQTTDASARDDSASHAPKPHIGHVAAWGALIPGLLTGPHIRYTKMTPDHIVFSPKDNTVRVMGGFSGIKRIEWPEDARLHHDDIAVFRRSFGAALTSALRLGYIYRLGPIAEWVFFHERPRSILWLSV